MGGVVRAPFLPPLGLADAARADLRRLGQTTKVVKSSLNDVRAKIAELRAKTADVTDTKKYDFEQRMKDIKAEELKSKLEAKEAKKKKKVEAPAQTDEEIMKAMGFGSFA